MIPFTSLVIPESTLRCIASNIAINYASFEYLIPTFLVLKAIRDKIKKYASSPLDSTPLKINLFQMNNILQKDNTIDSPTSYIAWTISTRHHDRAANDEQLSHFIPYKKDMLSGCQTIPRFLQIVSRTKYLQTFKTTGFGPASLRESIKPVHDLTENLPLTS
ncbi:hypothetical protein NC653_038143 [Populus alba x Populus x berolinensis]|uniref:Uncharacterized protein n=1 Tax=Populus alba x Populus x berolinensis TaxID=444605 RepID=A0AAD6LFY8_9ROSI|nr:hypothetical protein NC653_038143 [Populus alba x Populus x berolinensis]